MEGEALSTPENSCRLLGTCRALSVRIGSMVAGKLDWVICFRIESGFAPFAQQNIGFTRSKK